MTVVLIFDALGVPAILKVVSLFVAAFSEIYAPGGAFDTNPLVVTVFLGNVMVMVIAIACISQHTSEGRGTVLPPLALRDSEANLFFGVSHPLLPGPPGLFFGRHRFLFLGAVAASVFVGKPRDENAVLAIAFALSG